MVNAIGEVDWHSPHFPLTFYNQVFAFNSELSSQWQTNIVNNLGFRWTPDSHWAVSFQWRQDLATFTGAPAVGVFAFQVRYRT